MNIMTSLKNTRAASLVIYILRSLRSHTFVQYDKYNYHSPTCGLHDAGGRETSLGEVGEYSVWME